MLILQSAIVKSQYPGPASLSRWAAVSDKYEKINRSEIDDPNVQLEEPCWGDSIK